MFEDGRRRIDIARIPQHQRLERRVSEGERICAGRVENHLPPRSRGSAHIDIGQGHTRDIVVSLERQGSLTGRTSHSHVRQRHAAQRTMSRVGRCQ